MPSISGKELSHYGKEIMEAAGWVRLACFNSYRAMPRGARGMSDNLYVRDGVLLFVEDKGTGDTLRIEQAEFAEHIKMNAPPNVYYLICSSKEDYDKFAQIRKDENEI